MTTLLKTGRNKIYSAIAAGAALLLAIVLILTNSGGLHLFAARANTPDYTITLDSSNAVSSAGKHVQHTKKGNEVEFNYTNVGLFSGGHTRLNNGGTIVNVDQITSITEITAVFSTSGSLQFRTAIGGDYWGGYTTMVSGQTYELGSNSYYVEFSASSSSVDITSINIGFSCVANPNAGGTEHPSEYSWNRVTSASDIADGDEVVVVGVYNSTYHTLEDSLAASVSYYLAAADISLTDSNTKATVTDQTTWILNSRTGNTWSFHSTSDTSYFLSGTYASSKYYNIGRETSYSSSNCNWVLTFDSSEKTFDAKLNSSGTNVYLGFQYYNNTKYEFYGVSSAHNLLMFKKTVSSSYTEYDIPVDEVGFTATLTKTEYKVEDIFASTSGLSVVANKNDGTTTPISQGVNGYSYTITNDSTGLTIDPTSAFGNSQAAAGNYTVVVSYKNYINQVFHISVEFEVKISAISDLSTGQISSVNTANKLSDFTLSDLTCTVSYNTGASESVTYANFGTKGLTLELLNPNSVVYSQTTVFGTAGTWKLKVKANSDSSIYAEYSFTVNAIPVETISVTGASYSVEEGKTLQLTATVSPSTATVQAVSWASSATAVATVSSTGLVTGKSAGSARITATATDGSAKYGYADITVTEKTAGADEGTFILSTGSLTVGSYVVFASTNYDGSGYAMSSTQNTNNRPGESVTISNSTLERDSNSAFRAFLVQEGTTSGTYSFYDETAGGYLYAASSGSNYLRTETTKTANSSFTVTGAESKTITAQGNNSHNLLKWNTTSKIFSCYQSGQAAPYIFEKTGEPKYATSISISGDSSVAVGSTTTLSVSYTPSDTNMKTVSWSSSNDTVASVEDGVVTGIKAGTATITATVPGANSTTISTTKQITVSNVAVTSVSLNKNSTSIEEGSTETLVATINPSNATNKNVTWSTSDNSVATVDEGVVTAKSAGTSTITVTTQDGNKSASCTVTVTSSGGGGGGSGGEETTTYTFNTKSWGASPANWTSGKDGNQFQSGQGIQVTTGASGANGTSPKSFESVQSVVVGYCTNASKGTGTIAVSVGGTKIASQSVTKSGGTSVRDMTFTSDGSLSGTVKITVTCTDNSIYIASCSITTGVAEAISPTGITITPNTLGLAKNRSQTLSVNYTPSNANTNKAVTWTSNNTSVATVDSSGKVTVTSTATVGQTATITAKLTNITSVSNTATVTVVETANADHTVLIYMCGADLESGQYRLASGDITEMKSVSSQPSDVNIVIETGGANSWASTHGISSKYLQRHHIANKKLVHDDGQTAITYASMGETSTLQSFIEYGIENYPANRYGLVLWNHGGAMRGVCYDEKENDDTLLDYEVRNAVTGALSTEGMTGQKLEWIGYDACLMQVQDIAEMNSPYFNYMVASEESEAGYGWDYDTWVDDLYAKKSTPTILKAIVDGFIADNGGTDDGENDQTLSYLNLSYASAYKTAWENMASALSNKITSGNRSSFNNLVKGCKYYADADYTYFGLFDAKDFINKLASNSTFNPGSSYTNAVLTAHNNLVAYSSCGAAAGNSYGLAMFWAAASDAEKSKFYTESTTNFSNWRSIVKTYGY